MSKYIYIVILLLSCFITTSCNNSSNIKPSGIEGATKSEEEIDKQLKKSSKFISMLENSGITLTIDQKVQIKDIFQDSDFNGLSKENRKELKIKTREEIIEKVLTDEQKKLIKKKG